MGRRMMTIAKVRSKRMRSLLLVFLLAGMASSGAPPDRAQKNEPGERYLVFPGSDADPNEVSEWGSGKTTLFNVLFGPKPYAFGWHGQQSFTDKPENRRKES